MFGLDDKTTATIVVALVGAGAAVLFKALSDLVSWTGKSFLGRRKKKEADDLERWQRGLPHAETALTLVSEIGRNPTQALLGASAPPGGETPMMTRQRIDDAALRIPDREVRGFLLRFTLDLTVMRSGRADRGTELDLAAGTLAGAVRLIIAAYIRREAITDGQKKTFNESEKRALAAATAPTAAERSESAS